MERAFEERVKLLTPGTRVGAWRVKAWQGQGAYGAVYLAERRGFRGSERGALKVSLLPWGWRMRREVELLSRLSHPSIPRLLDRGGPSAGAEYPFFVMEWVEGPALYAWAEQHAPSYRQMCRVLAQVARALEAVHAAGAVHRDVKGDNVLVRLSDRRAMLMDFGSCHFPGAQKLTWQSLPPVTLEYLSPQAGLFHLRSREEPDSYYPPSAGDDLYALGVTACRLVMGQYPPPLEVRKDEEGGLRVRSPDMRPLLENHAQADPRLREVILRLLADAPEARGTARQVAEELEAAAGETGQGAERPERPKVVVRSQAWRRWPALAAAGACAVLLWNSQRVPRPSGAVAVSTPGASEAQAPDDGTAAVGDTSPTEPQASTPAPMQEQPLAQEPLPEPRPGQARPDEKGRCPGRKHVPINGGCWIDVSPLLDAQDCAESGYVLFKGRCYGPANAPAKKPAPTSSPVEAR